MGDCKLHDMFMDFECHRTQAKVEYSIHGYREGYVEELGITLCRNQYT